MYKEKLSDFLTEFSGNIVDCEQANFLRLLFEAMVPNSDYNLLDAPIDNALTVRRYGLDIDFFIKQTFGTNDLVGYALSDQNIPMIEVNLKQKRISEFYKKLYDLGVRYIFNPHSGLLINFYSYTRDVVIGRIPKYIWQGHEKYVYDIAKILDAKLLTQDQADVIYSYSQKVFIESLSETIDWNMIKNRIFVEFNKNLIIPVLNHFLNKSFDQRVFVSYVYPHFGYMQTELQTVVSNFDELRQIPLPKFIINPFCGYIIELRHVGDIKVGVVPKIYYRQFADTWWHGYGEVK